MPNWDLVRGDQVRVRRLPLNFADLPADQQRVFDMCRGRVFEVRGLDDRGMVEIDVTRIAERERIPLDEAIFIEAECLELLDR